MQPERLRRWTLGTATATDVFDSNPTITNDAPASFRTGTTTVTWTATDSAGNEATATQRVTVRETTPPLRISAPSSLTVEATGLLTAVDLGTPTVTDAGPNAVITNDAPESFPLGYDDSYLDGDGLGHHGEKRTR